MIRTGITSRRIFHVEAMVLADLGMYNSQDPVRIQSRLSRTRKTNLSLFPINSLRRGWARQLHRNATLYDTMLMQIEDVDIFSDTLPTVSFLAFMNREGHNYKWKCLMTSSRFDV
jgi:hypothetical protein